MPRQAPAADLRPPLPIVRRPGTHCLAAAVFQGPCIEENPLSSWMTFPAPTSNWHVGISSSNPFAFVAAFFPQVGQHAGSLLSGAPSIRMPERHLREVELASRLAVGMPEDHHPSDRSSLVHCLSSLHRKGGVFKLAQSYTTIRIETATHALRCSESHAGD